MALAGRSSKTPGGRAFLALAALVFLGSCAHPPFPPDVVARYDGGVVSLAEVTERIGRDQSARRSPTNGESEEPLGARRARFARRIVAERTWVEGMTEERLAAETSLRQHLRQLEAATLLAFTQSQGLGVSSLVSEEEVRQRYAQLGGRLELAATHTLRHVYCRVDEGAAAATWAATRQEAAGVRALLLSPGADLDEIIATHSDSEDATTGGWIRRLPLGTLNISPSFEAAVSRLKPGEVSEPIETRRGYHVVLLVNANPARTLSFEELRDHLVGQVVQERRQARIDEIVRAREASDPLSFDFEALRTGTPDAIVLRGAKSSVTLAELTAEEPLLTALVAKPGSQDTEVASERAKSVIHSRYLLEFARHEGLDRRPEFVEQWSRRRREAIVDFVYGGLLRERIAKTSPAVFKAFYEESRSRFATQRRVHLVGFFLEHASRDLYATFAFAERLKSRLESGESLAALVSEHAALQGMKNTGDHGWMTHDDLAARGRLFHDTVVAAKTGEWLGPVKWERGYAVVRVEEVEEPTIPPYEEISAKVHRAYSRRKDAEIREAIEQLVFARRGGELNPELVQAEP